MRRVLAITLAWALAATAAAAHHPGERLDEVMAEKEPAFEPTDLRRLPSHDLRLADGAALDLRDPADRIVVLSFVPQDCGAPCADQQAALVEAQAAVNVTPMREMVTFVTVGPADAATERPAGAERRYPVPCSPWKPPVARIGTRRTPATTSTSARSHRRASRRSRAAVSARTRSASSGATTSPWWRGSQ